ncbi:MAG: hypothetical protein LUD51_01485 [Clostridia bacterium]|nr:hypothetical protein [Clostridia bacterium]
MFYVKCRNNRTGITYVYESESYWDKEKKMPSARRKLIGKVDEATGEIVPCGKRGRKPKDPDGKAAELEEKIRAELETRYADLMQQKDSRIASLEAENRQLKAEKAEFKAALANVMQQYK